MSFCQDVEGSCSSFHRWVLCVAGSLEITGTLEAGIRRMLFSISHLLDECTIPISLGETGTKRGLVLVASQMRESIPLTYRHDNTNSIINPIL